MEYILRRIHKAGIFGWLYVMTLLHAFHFFAVHFVNSSFLEQYVSQTEIGFIFAISSLLTLIALASVVVFLTKFGNYYTALFAILIDFTASLGLVFTTNIGWIFVFFVLQAVMVSVTLFCFDVFLENYSKDEEKTGSVRGLFLTMSMLASLFSPVISGWLLGDTSVYQTAYLASALYLLPTLVILLSHFRTFADPVYEILSVRNMFQAIRTNKNIFHISSAQFLLRFYFSWMVVYLPIYLHRYIGFSWLEIGIILFIMIIPYILIEFPAGVIADKWLGEKELLFGGFVITSVSTMALFFLDSTNLLVWGGILFATRIGCALIESMSETYFFKQIDGDDTSILSIFRMLRPLAYIVGPLSAGVLLIYIDIQYLWVLLAGVMLLGIWNALALVDTK
jgi:MFS family permease